MEQELFQKSKEQKLKPGLQFNWDDVPRSQKEYVEELLRWKGDGFDIRTHIVDPKTGALLKFQPYRRVCDGGGSYYLRDDEGGITRKYSEQGEILNPDMAPEVAAPKPEKKHVGQRISA